MKYVKLMLMAVCFIAVATSCNKDKKIKEKIEAAFKANPDMANCTVDVKDGVATLSGECKDQACKDKCCEEAKANGAKDCVNNCTVKEIPKPVEVAEDAALVKGLAEAISSYPTVQGMVKEGQFILSGSIKTADWKQLQQVLMKLGATKGPDIKGLKLN